MEKMDARNNIGVAYVYLLHGVFTEMLKSSSQMVTYLTSNQLAITPIRIFLKFFTEKVSPVLKSVVISIAALDALFEKRLAPAKC